MREFTPAHEKGPRPYFRRYTVPDPVQKRELLTMSAFRKGLAIVSVFALLITSSAPTVFAVPADDAGSANKIEQTSEIVAPENGPNLGEGHTPVALCHAKGNGDFVYIEIDDSGLNGHDGHDGDYIIYADDEDQTCGETGVIIVCHGNGDGSFTEVEFPDTKDGLKEAKDYVKDNKETGDYITKTGDCPTVVEEDETVQVTIVKYIGSSPATSTNTENASFAMHSNWSDAGHIGTGEGDYALNAGNSYSATTSEMDEGANYSTYEVINDVVGNSCEDEKPFALLGYSTGNSLANAASASVSETAPSFTDLTEDKFVVVHNEKCGEVAGDFDATLHFIKVVCDQYSDISGNESGTVNDDTNGAYTQFANYNGGAFSTAVQPVTPAEIPNLASGCVRVPNWQFKLSTDQEQSSNVSTIGLTAGNSSTAEYTTQISNLTDAQQDAIMNGMLWVSEVTQDGYNFGAIRCYNDALNGDNLEFISIGNDTPEDIYCIAYNVATGVTINAQKIVCDDESRLPNLSGRADVSSTTAATFLATGDNAQHCHFENWDFQWGYGDKAGHEGVDMTLGTTIGAADGVSTAGMCMTPFCGPNTSSGSGFNQWHDFNAPSGVQGMTTVVIPSMDGSDRIWVREELKAGYHPFSAPVTGQALDSNNVSAELYCSTDTLNYDNYDFILNPTPGQTYHCIAFNAITTPEQPRTVDVTIAKFVDGSLATAASTNSTSFPMVSSWTTTNMPSGSGEYSLSTTGFNNPNAYYATTSQMNVGSSYTTNEVIGSTVGTSCQSGTPYALTGYSVGTSLEDASDNPTSLTIPSFTNLQSDMFVIVRNQKCGTVAGDVDTRVNFIKVVCDQYSDIMGNESGMTADATGNMFVNFSNYNGGTFSPSALVGGFVNPSEIPATSTGCVREDGFSFKLSSDQAQTANVMVYGATAGTSTDAGYSILESALTPELRTALNSGQLWVSEVEQTGYDFGAIRCYNDALNGDNLEFISLNGANPENVYCIAYNVTDTTELPQPCVDTTLNIDSGSNTLTAGYTETNPQANPLSAALYSSGSFGTSASANTVIPPWVDPATNPSFSGSGAVWVSSTAAHPGDTGGQGSSTLNQWRLFHHQFTVPVGATVEQETLYYTADNAVTVYLNGTSISNTTEVSTFGATPGSIHDVYANVYSVTYTPVAGQVNTLAFVVRNSETSGNSNPTGLLYTTDVTVDCEVQPTNSGGGSSSGSRRNSGRVLGDNDFGPGLQMPVGTPGGLVLGDSTNTPSNNNDRGGNVLGASDSLPRTGTSLWAMLVIALMAGTAFGMKSLNMKKSAK